jgi:hypothetical protein
MPATRLPAIGPAFNIAPTDQHFIVTSEFERRKAQHASWGLVNRWAKDNSRASQCINAKAETIEQRSTFREAFQQRRCVVPADGFYEWTGPRNKRQPLWIHPRSGGLILFAGVYESWLLVPAPSGLLVMQPASPLANSVKNEGPTLLKVWPSMFKTANVPSNTCAVLAASSCS